MKHWLVIFFCATWSLALPAWAEEEPVEPEEEEVEPEPTPQPMPEHLTETELLGVLGEAQLDQAIEVLKRNYFQAAALSDREIKRAKMAGLLDRLGTGIELVVLTEDGEPVEPEPGHPFLAEVIDGRVGYIRLSGITAGDLAQADALLQEWSDKEIAALILDLRNVGYSDDFEAAADFARRFTPKGRLLFRLDRPGAKQERIFTANQEPLFEGTIVVLVNRKTAGAAELLSAVLRSAVGGMVLGAATAGKPVEYASFPLGGGTGIRLAVAEAIVGEDQRGFPNGFRPDLQIEVPSAEEELLLQAATERGVSALVFEKDLPRMNEAALIANANPELRPSDASSDPPSMDRALQRAVDIVTALQFYQPKSPGKTSDEP